MSNFNEGKTVCVLGQVWGPVVEAADGMYVCQLPSVYHLAVGEHDLGLSNYFNSWTDHLNMIYPVKIAIRTSPFFLPNDAEFVFTPAVLIQGGTKQSIVVKSGSLIEGFVPNY